MRSVVLVLLAACSSATWDDTFQGQDARSTSLGDAALPPDGGSPLACAGLAASSPPVPITVTFPGHGTASETIHVVTASGSCDLVINTDTDGVAFASDAIPCANLIVPGTPISGTATASGSSSPNDLLFQWDYGIACTIIDDYALEKQ
jgi:hypothetical protein